MGIGFVAFFWLFLAVSVGAALAAGAWIGGNKRRPDLRRRRTEFAFLLPFAMLAWVCPAGLLWVGWGKLTGFNAQFGTGDSWAVSLPNGYTLEFIDVETEASVHEPRSPVAVVGGVTQIAAAADCVYGVAGASAFVIETTSGQVQKGSAQSLFKAAGLDGNAIVPVAQYPGRRRNAIDNIVLALLLLGPPAVLGRRYWVRRLSDRGEPGLTGAG